MTTITITPTETRVLQQAVANDGCLQLADPMKPASRTRLIGRLQKPR